MFWVDMVERLLPEQLQMLADAHRFFDSSGSGLGPKELGAAFRSFGLKATVAELQDIVNEAGGAVSEAEFAHLMTKRFRDCDTTEEIKDAFGTIDFDGDGVIDLILPGKEGPVLYQTV